MSGASASLLRPPRRKARGFMLIPLVDVIFLLLTFFMLASSIDPFSLLTLDDLRSRGGSQPAPRSQPQPPPDLIVAVGRDLVQANGAAVPLAGFAGAALALRAQGLQRVLVVARPAATVQDVVAVIDALKKASFPAVVIRGGSGAFAG